MRLRRSAALVAAMLAAAMLAGGPAALGASAYQPGDNTTVGVTLPVGLPSLGTGALTMGLQEDLQGTVQGLLGTSIGYDFVVFDVNGQPVAGVDPFAVYTD